MGDRFAGMTRPIIAKPAMTQMSRCGLDYMGCLGMHSIRQ